MINSVNPERLQWVSDLVEQSLGQHLSDIKMEKATFVDFGSRPALRFSSNSSCM